MWWGLSSLTLLTDGLTDGSCLIADYNGVSDPCRTFEVSEFATRTDLTEN